MTATVNVWQYPFKPYKKQREALISPADEVLFGGSLGGGKSEVLLAACMTVCTLVPGAKALLIRRTFPELSELVKRLRERIPAEVARYNKQDHVFYFANGAELHLGYCERPEDATRYQGHEFVLVCFDELTHYDKESYVLLMSRLRATGPVADRMRQLRLPLRTLSASNPGSKGHNWVKAHFIDPAPHRTLFVDKDSGAQRIFIPSSLYDNPYIDHEEYLKKLGAMDPELKRAMVDGDWDIVSGVRFGQWRTKHHVISPDSLPIPGLTGRKVIAVDYGFSAPFAAVWLCLLHDGLVVQYREEYATELTARQQAKRILELSAEEEAVTGEKIPIVMDPAMWRRNDATTRKSLDPDLPPVGSPAHDYMKVLGRVPHKGVNARVHGWHQLDEKLLVQKDGFPRYMVYDTCRDTIRTLPALPRDKKNPEDVLTTAEDHLCFVGDTLIATEHGQVPIREVRIGDRVWTRAGLRSVTESMMTQRNAPVGRVEFSNGSILEGTANHPVFTQRGVVDLGRLLVGDAVQVFGGGTASVVSTFVPTGNADVYNLTVEGEHEYFANGVLVHNCDAIRYGLMYLAGMRVGQKSAEQRRKASSPITGGLRSNAF